MRKPHRPMNRVESDQPIGVERAEPQRLARETQRINTYYGQDGTVMQFAIEKTRGSGDVTAFNPTTQERFSGTYVAVVQGTNVSSRAYVTNGVDSASGVTASTARSNLADSTAYLRGDKGTMLSCSMAIQPGVYPHGIGTCTDNNRTGYRLQF